MFQAVAARSRGRSIRRFVLVVLIALGGALPAGADPVQPFRAGDLPLDPSSSARDAVERLLPWFRGHRTP